MKSESCIPGLESIVHKFTRFSANDKSIVNLWSLNAVNLCNNWCLFCLRSMMLDLSFTSFIRTQRWSSFFERIRWTVLYIMTETERLSSWVYLYDRLYSSSKFNVFIYYLCKTLNEMKQQWRWKTHYIYFCSILTPDNCFSNKEHFILIEVAHYCNNNINSSNNNDGDNDNGYNKKWWVMFQKVTCKHIRLNNKIESNMVKRQKLDWI